MWFDLAFFVIALFALVLTRFAETPEEFIAPGEFVHKKNTETRQQKTELSPNDSKACKQMSSRVKSLRAFQLELTFSSLESRVNVFKACLFHTLSSKSIHNKLKEEEKRVRKGKRKYKTKIFWQKAIHKREASACRRCYQSLLCMCTKERWREIAGVSRKPVSYIIILSTTLCVSLLLKMC